MSRVLVWMRLMYTLYDKYLCVFVK